MVVTAIQRFSDAGPGVVITPRSDLDPRGVFRSSAGVTGSSVVVRRTVFDRVGGFDPGLPVQNDRDFFLRVLDGGHRYAVQPQPLVEMRDHGHGRLTDASARRADGVLLFLAKHGSRFSWWDRRILRYTSHYTRMACAWSRSDFVASACGALVNWSPTVARNLPLRLFRVDRLRSLGRKLSGRAWWSTSLRPRRWPVGGPGYADHHHRPNPAHRHPVRLDRHPGPTARPGRLRLPGHGAGDHRGR